MKKVIFVCTGNICRSPTAEGVFRHFVHKEGLQKEFLIESAGLTDYHEGENADNRTIQTALKRGYDLSQIISRPLVRQDFQSFDFLIAMDKGHHEALLQLCPDPLKDKKTIKLFMDYSKKFSGQSVPDPYYGNGQGFETVLDMIEDASLGLLNELKKIQY